MSNLARIALSAVLVAVATGPAARAQTVTPSGGISASDIAGSGISVEVDPQKGASVGVDAGETGGVTAGAGTQGVQLNLKQGAVKLPGSAGQTTTPQQTSETPSRVGAPVRDPSRTGDAGPSGPTSGAFSVVGGEGTAAGASADGTARDRSSGRSGDRRAGAKSAAERDSSKGVAPVIDLIEKIPPALWAAMAALGLIALALWMMWVRGRRQLERNAWVDTDSPEMNVVAFETLLAQEWARSERYNRPLGLLLLELEEPTSDGGRRPLTGRYRSDAQDAITAQARPADTVAQLSPSRFAVICPESSPGSVETLAHALEHSLEAARVHARVGTAGRLESDPGPADLVSRAAVGIDEQPTWATPVITAPGAAPESQPVAV
jgi:GGDEF domain-containing protein